MREKNFRKCSRGLVGGDICLRQSIAKTMSAGSKESKRAIEMKILREYRKARVESQTCFWSRFGVTQSRGSRYEMGLDIPPPVAILLMLYFDGVLGDDDLPQGGSSSVAKLRICGKCWQLA